MDTLRVRRSLQEIVRLNGIEVLENARNIEQIAPFRKRELFVEDLAFANLVEDLKRCGFRSEPVFARLEGGSGMERACGHEGPRRAHDTMACEQVADRAR